MAGPDQSEDASFCILSSLKICSVLTAFSSSTSQTSAQSPFRFTTYKKGGRGQTVLAKDSIRRRPFLACATARRSSKSIVSPWYKDGGYPCVTGDALRSRGIGTRASALGPLLALTSQRTGAEWSRLGPASRMCSGHSASMSLKFSMKRAARASYFW